MCVQPLEGWYARQRTASGKRAIVFDIKEGYHDRPVRVACGTCVECVSRRARDWAARCVHEASLHEENSFVTLTYGELPAGGSLCRRDVQLFFKRMRKHGADFRYFGCGEYGERFRRPHYHLCLFGFDPPDKVHHTHRKGFEVWRSNWLEARWENGIVEVGTFTPRAAGYVARYLTKRGRSPDGCVPEFLMASRKPAIGRRWYESFREESYRHDSVIVGGKEVQLPAYYDRLEEERSPAGLRRVKRQRVASVKELEERGTRWLTRKECGDARVNLFRRELQA